MIDKRTPKEIAQDIANSFELSEHDRLRLEVLIEQAIVEQIIIATASVILK